MLISFVVCLKLTVTIKLMELHVMNEEGLFRKISRS